MQIHLTLEPPYLLTHTVTTHILPSGVSVCVLSQELAFQPAPIKEAFPDRSLVSSFRG